MRTFNKNQITALRLARKGMTPTEIHKLKGMPKSTADYALKSARRKIDQAIELLRYAVEIGGLNERQAKDLKSFIQKA